MRMNPQYSEGIDARAMTIRGGLLALLAVLLFSATASANGSCIGNVNAVESKDPTAYVKIIRNGYSGILHGMTGAAVYTGDALKTGENVRAEIELSDGSTITLAPNAAVEMKGYLVERTEGKRSAVMKVLKGVMRFVISKLFRPNVSATEMQWKDTNVMIESMNAVAGVRGTELVVSQEKDVVEIAVLDGAVIVRGVTPDQKGEVMLGANQLTRVEKGKNPGQPSELSPERRQELLRATTIDKGFLSNGTGASGNRKGNRYSGKDVARDLASGLPLGTVMDKAIDSGMTIDEFIGAALDEAGMAPGYLIYTSITEGYPAKAVAQAAIEHGVSLGIVVSTAMGAGADKNAIIAGALDAGVPPPMMASALANGSAPHTLSGGEGFSGGEAPSAVIPSPPVTFGGGGGAMPSTRPASPYRP